MGVGAAALGPGTPWDFGRFYYDGKEVARTSEGGVCQVPLSIKVTTEIGDWAGDIKKAKLPDEFVVDWDKVYDRVDASSGEKKGDPAPAPAGKKEW